MELPSYKMDVLYESFQGFVSLLPKGDEGWLLHLSYIHLLIFCVKVAFFHSTNLCYKNPDEWDTRRQSADSSETGEPSARSTESHFAETFRPGAARLRCYWYVLSCYRC